MITHVTTTIRIFETQKQFDEWIKVFEGQMHRAGFSFEEVQQLLHFGSISVLDKENGVPHTKTVTQLVTQKEFIARF